MNPIKRTLAIVQAEYFQTAAVIGEKVGTIKSLEKEIEEFAVKLIQLFDEQQIHMTAKEQADAAIEASKPKENPSQREDNTGPAKEGVQ